MSAGSQRYKSSPKGQRRGHSKKARPPAAVTFGRERFRLTCRRKRGPVKLPPISLDELTSEVEWQRQGTARAGTLTFNEPTGKRRSRGLVAHGDVIRCECDAQGDGRFRPLWEMEVTTPQRSIRDGAATLSMRSRLGTSQRSKVAWKFRKDKRHPKGWTADQIARYAAKRMKITLGKVARGKYRITRLVDKSASATEIVTAAYKEEREHEGRRFDVSIATGLLEVHELRRPRYMLLMGPGLIDAVVEMTLGGKFASAVVVTSTVKSAKGKRRKIRAKVVDRARVRRYGYVVRHIERRGLKSVAAARKAGQRYMARDAKPKRAITLTHPGIPWVDRGDAVRLYLPEESLTAVVYVTSVVHRLGYGSYEMEVTVSVQDPWERDERAARATRRREAVRRARKRAGAEKAERKKAAKSRRRQ